MKYQWLFFLLKNKMSSAAAVNSSLRVKLHYQGNFNEMSQHMIANSRKGPLYNLQTRRNEGPDQLAHSCRLIRAIVARLQNHG